MAVYTSIPDAHSYLKGCLEQTFEGLKKANVGAPVKEKSLRFSAPEEISVSCVYGFTLNETAYKVAILMNCQNLAPPVALCGGKFASHSAEITLSPSNKGIEDAIKKTFQEWMAPGTSVIPERQFNQLKINGQEIPFAS